MFKHYGIFEWFFRKPGKTTIRRSPLNDVEELEGRIVPHSVISVINSSTNTEVWRKESIGPTDWSWLNGTIPLGRRLVANERVDVSVSLEALDRNSYSTMEVNVNPGSNNPVLRVSDSVSYSGASDGPTQSSGTGVVKYAADATLSYNIGFGAVRGDEVYATIRYNIPKTDLAGHALKYDSLILNPATGNIEFQFDLRGNTIEKDARIRYFWANDQNQSLGDISLPDSVTILKAGAPVTVGSAPGFKMILTPAMVDIPPAGATRLCAELDSLGVIDETNESNTSIYLLPMPNIKVLDPEYKANGNFSIRYQYTTPPISRIPTKPGVLQAYWSNGDTFMGGPIASFNVSSNTNTIGRKDISYSSLPPAPEGATHLIIRLDGNDTISDADPADNLIKVALPNYSVSKFEWGENGLPVLTVRATGTTPKGIQPLVGVYWAKGSQVIGSPVWQDTIRTTSQKGTQSGTWNQASGFEYDHVVMLSKGALTKRPAGADSLVARTDFDLRVVEPLGTNEMALTGGYSPTVASSKYQKPVVVKAGAWKGSDPSDVWTMQAGITADDGLQLKNVIMGGRYVAKSMDLPYYVLDTEKLGKVRGELKPNGAQSQLRSRLIELTGPIFENRASELGSDGGTPLVIRAKYIIDRLGNDCKNYLEITQEYRFYKADPNVIAFSPMTDEFVNLAKSQLIKKLVENHLYETAAVASVFVNAIPNDTIREYLSGHAGPAARFYPTTSYRYVSSDGDQLKSVTLPLRLDFQLNNQRKNATTFFKDSDLAPFEELPFTTLLNENPLKNETLVHAILQGQAGKMDNIHITFKNEVEPPVPANLDELWQRIVNQGTHVLPPGAEEAIHIHWRWGNALKYPDKDHPGAPIIPPGSNQSVNVGIVRYRKSEGEPIDWKTLDNNHEGIAGKDSVMWYEGIGYLNTDTFFGHGGFVEKLEEPTATDPLVEHPAIAQAQLSINSMASVRMAMLDDDPDVNLDALTVNITQPRSGQVKRDGLDVVYTPNTQDFEDDGFQYTVSDDEGTFRNVSVKLGSPPKSPIGLRAEPASAGTVRLRWTDRSATETKFVVEASTDEGLSWRLQENVPPNSTTAEVNLPQSPTVLFRVRAVNSHGNSTPTNSVAVQGKSQDPPVTPGNLHAVNTWPRKLDLNWDDLSDNETAFRIAMSSDGGATWNNVGVTGANDTSLRVENLQPGTRYLFKMRAANGEVYSDYSNVLEITTPQEAPATPGNFRTANVYPRKIDFNWDDLSNNETSFRIAMSSDGGASWNNIGVTDANAVSWRVENLLPGTRYLFKMRAANGDVYSDYSNVLDITTPQETPVTPGNLRMTNLWARTIDLNWDDLSNNETAFRVAMSSDGGATWNNVGVTGANVTSLRVENLLPNTRYLFKMRAANGEVYSDYSNVLDIITRQEPPAAPGNLRTSNIWARTIDLKWDDRSNNETEFRIAISRDGGATWDNIGVVGADVTSFRVANLNPNTRYLFKVRAGNSVGYSDYSNIIDVRTLPS
ncbi:MAG TPA: fibronectin type III domain-containing protein [Gemmatales bacterium]|nr:fibronectin type III domain-containing protein [Gemmatales bacterium]